MVQDRHQSRNMVNSVTDLHLHKMRGTSRLPDYLLAYNDFCAVQLFRLIDT
jgi:hypothetical protein